MKVVQIDNQNHQPTEESLNRIQLINKALSKNGYEIKDDITLAYERTFKKVLSFFLDQRHSKILYTLHNVYFSSFWEMYRIFQLGYVQKLQNIIGTFEKYGIVDELKPEHKDYNIIISFWRNEYPNTRQKTDPKLFIINNSFKPVINEFSPHIFKKYIWKSDYNKIVSRKERYEKLYEKESKKYKAQSKLEKNKMGNCNKCNEIIKNGSIRGKDYHDYNGRLICDYCDKNKVTNEEKIKWTLQSK